MGDFHRNRLVQVQSKGLNRSVEGQIRDSTTLWVDVYGIGSWGWEWGLEAPCMWDVNCGRQEA